MFDLRHLHFNLFYNCILAPGEVKCKRRLSCRNRYVTCLFPFPGKLSGGEIDKSAHYIYNTYGMKKKKEIKEKVALSPHNKVVHAFLCASNNAKSLFRKINDTEKATEYLGILIRYLASGAKHLSGKELADTVTKALERRGDVMATIAEQWVKEGEEIGEKRGEKKGEEKNSWEVAKRALKKGFSVETIMELTGLPTDKINSLKEKMA
ncbi:MAG: hypothetical protein GY765_19845 [bacterium]|nr:hypothetical protein [bacterium]